MSLERVLDEAEARQLPALIDDWRDAPDERRWIARALRIDLALLEAHPELVIPALHRRCARLAGRFHHPEAPALPALQATIEAWTAAWSAGRPWLRAVRPPRVPLQAGVIEEYRTSVEGAPWVSAKVVGAGGVAWERVTGRRIAMAEPPRPPWRLGVRRAAGAATIASDRDGVWIAFDERDTPTALVVVDPRHVILDVTNDEHDAHYLVDALAGKVEWRADGHVASACAVDDGILVAIAGDLVLEDRARGTELATWRSFPCDALASSRDGCLVTRTDEVIRVWDRAQIPADFPAAVEWRGDVQLSPSCDRLITRDLLCDARTGAPIASLITVARETSLHPPNAWQLRDRVYAQCTDYGLDLWDTATGSRFLADGSRSATAGDHFELDPTGRFIALARGGVLALSGLRRTLFAQPAEVAQLGFSRDGEQLWWIAPTGERYAVATSAPHVPAQIAELPETVVVRRVPVRDGLVSVDGLIGIVDDREVIASPDGAIVAGITSHLVRAP